MITIYIFADSYKIYEQAIGEYQKRLGKELSIIKLKPSKKKTPNEMITDETETLLTLLPKLKGCKTILSPEGKKFSTQSLYDYIEKQKQLSGKVNCIIGGANGLDYKKLQNQVDLELSLSDFTLPHALALLVLTEQIYRLSMMKKGTNYNK